MKFFFLNKQFLLFVASLFLVTASTFPKPAFSADTTVAGNIEEYVSKMISGDFDGDGNQDVAVCTLYSPEISIECGYSTDGTSVDTYNRDTTSDFYDPNFCQTRVGSVRIYYSISSSTGSDLTHSDADFTITGDSENEFFGINCASGDFNNDGKDDILIGTNDEKVYLLLNTKIFAESKKDATISDIISASSSDVKVFVSGSASTEFGNQVANAGDFNGDGINDIIIADSKNDKSDTNAGAIYIIPGSTSISSGLISALAIAEYTGENRNDMLGLSIASAGDVNNDGVDDIIVGAPYANSKQGIAYLILGSTSPSSGSVATYGIKYTGANSGDYFGYSVAGIGDFNNDGYGDIAIGAPYNDYNGSDSGLVYIIKGKASLSAGTGTLYKTTKLSGENASDYFGYSISGINDINGDGYDDLLIGANGFSSSSSRVGAAYVIFGGTKLLSSTFGSKKEASSKKFSIYKPVEAVPSYSIRKFIGKRYEETFGGYTSSTGDGSLLFIGAPGNSDEGLRGGKVWIIDSSTLPDSSDGYERTVK